MKINIQESLKERDAITENRYNFYNIYTANNYTVEQKKKIAEAIYKGTTATELLEILDDSEVEYREVKEYAKANSNRRFRDEDGNIFSIWDLLNDFIDWELDDKVEEEPDKSVTQLFIDYIRNSTDKNGTLEEINENLEESSYGGAFDIRDDQYFTKDDLMEFAEEVMYVLHTNADGPLATPDYTDLYVDGNQIFITVIDEDGNEFTDKISVDFRRIRRLSDLISKYTLPLAERIMAQAEDYYRDMNEGCSKKKKKLIKEDVDRDYAFYLNLIDIDVEDMLKEYHEAGDKSPSEILIERGYTDTDSEIMYKEVKDDNHTYRLVIDFEPVWEDNTIHYYVLKDGKIPAGYTYTKTSMDIEEVEKDLDNAGNSKTYFYDDESWEDEGVSARKDFEAEGREFTWVKRHGDVEHLDFDNWAVWEAYCRDDAETYYFIVDEDTGFIDWGPVDTLKEAQEFLVSKVSDWENIDESVSSKVDYKSFIKEIVPSKDRLSSIKPVYGFDSTQYLETSIEPNDDVINDIILELENRGFKLVDSFDPGDNNYEGWVTYAGNYVGNRILATVVYGPGYAIFKAGYVEDEAKDLFEGVRNKLKKLNLLIR